MKKLIFILVFQISILVAGYAQVIPKGMNYQAVARNLKGELISNEPIRLKISLFGNERGGRADHNAEMHEVITNNLGLFNLIIGEGKKEQGEYGLIPWNTENIWMEVAIQDKERTGFAPVSSSKLMAVPYALHAGTADRLVDQSTTPVSTFAPPEPGVISTEWSVFGNAKTDASGNIFRLNSLGTTDVVDLIMITNNVERMRIFSTGDILTKLNFEIGKSLTVGQTLYVVHSASVGDSLFVKKNVYLNTISGSTINCGPFTVADLRPTLLTGTLTVDQITDFNTTLNVDGPTDLNGALYVNKKGPTKLSGTLQVDSTTNLNAALYVNNMSPTYLTGTLEIDSAATFNDKVKITSMFTTDTSGLVPTGSLQVGGGAYIHENFYVGGIAKFGGPVTFAGAVSITDASQSTSTSTGALRVSGGVGIGLNLNVGGAAGIGGMLTVKDLTESIDSTTGALKIFGGAGIRKKLNVRGAGLFYGTLDVAGISNFNGGLNVSTSSNNFIASFINTTSQNGLIIQVNNAAPGWANNFVEFRNGNSQVVGRIEGENSTQFTSNANYIRQLNHLEAYILAAELTQFEALVNVVLAEGDLVAALSSSTACLGLGACVTFPIPSLVLVAGIRLAARIAIVFGAGYALDLAKERKTDFVDFHSNYYGVTYESGAGDYAEWLPKANQKEIFKPGDIVGVHGGLISKQIYTNSKLMVISSQPIVLGNMPEEDKKAQYEKVAFLGQVPVRVAGKVSVGDYILASGNHDGLGRACPVSKLRAEDYGKIVGMAWSEADGKEEQFINVAVGLQTNDFAKLIIRQEREIEALEKEFIETNEQLARMVPGFKPPAGLTDEGISNAASPLAEVNAKSLSALSKWDLSELKSSDLQETVGLVEKTFLKQGGSTETIALLNQLKTNPDFIDQYLKDIRFIDSKILRQQLEKIKSRQ